MRVAFPAVVLLVLFAAPAPRAQERGAIQRELADAWLSGYVPARDDPDELFYRLIAMAAKHADDPIAELLVDRATGELGALADPEKAATALRSLLAVKGHGLVERAARTALGRVLDLLGRSDEAREVDARDEYAKHFLVIGPFGDSGDYWNGQVFAPELRFPSGGEDLPGRFGPVEVRQVVRDDWQSDVDFGGGPYDDGCYYGLHQVRTAEPIACWLEITTSGSYELFVNGERMARLDRVVERVPQRRFEPIRLAPGVNHVLVKTTLAERHEVALRYVDAIGRALAGIEELADEDRVEPTPVSDELPERPAAFVDGLDALHRAARRRDDDVGDELLEIASTLADIVDGHRERGLASLWRQKDARPEDPRLSLALAECFRRADDLPDEIGAAASRRLVEAAARALPPEHHEAVIQTAQLMRADDALEDAVRLLEAQVAGGHAGPRTFATLDSLLGALSHESRRMQIRRMWLERRPQDERPVQLAASELLEAGRAREALQLVATALERRPGDASLLRISAEVAGHLGDRDTALAMIDRLHRRDPDSIEASRERASTLEALGDVRAAIESWRSVARAEEADADDLFAAGWQLWSLDDTEAALEAFRRCLTLDPSRHAVRQMLRRAAGEADMPFLERFRMSKAEVDAIVAGFEPTEREQGSPSTLVLDRMTVVFYPDGSSVQESHQLRRLNDLAGVEAHEQADTAARADEVVRLRTIAEDGRDYLPKRVRGTFAMPRLAPGAFIEELHRDYGRGGDAEPWRATEFWFQSESEPFVRSEFVLVLPPDAPGSVRTRNFPDDPERIELEDGWHALVFRRQDVPRLPREPRMPEAAGVVPIVTWGEDRSYGETARRTSVAARYRARVTAPIDRATADVLAGVDGGDRARLAALHAFVNGEIAEGRGSAEPTAILLTQRGPRFFLLVAMLEAAGVPFRHALAADEREALREGPPPLFLGEEDFSIPAVLVEPRDGAPVWLFADDPRHAPLGVVASARDGAAALLIDGDDYRVVRIRPEASAQPGWRSAGTLAVAPGGDARLSATLELGGTDGYELAERVRELDANRKTLIGRNLASQLFPGWTIDDARLPAREPGERLAAAVTAVRRGAAQRVGDTVTLPLPLPESDMFRRYGAPSPRTLPLDIRGETTEEWDLLVTPGDGLHLSGIPNDLRVSHELCDYVLTFRREAEGLRVRRTVRVRPGRVEPGMFASWIRLLQTIDRAEQGRIGFTTK